jgi:hypothetical protein
MSSGTDEAALAERAAGALGELLRGLQAAGGRRLARVEARQVQGGLVAVVLRVVFVDFAERRGLLPGELEQLRARPHDGSAWTRLLALLRRIGDELFPGWLAEYPLADEVVLRALERLRCADSGDRDVEQLGSVHEALRGYTLAREGEALELRSGDERRRSGAHYTPRELTGPIVEATLRPVLAALGERPTPGQLLSLKVCDPAMGSGAFLVEVCRQLGEHLARAWAEHGGAPAIAAGDELAACARRAVARRCLYGVDTDPSAVELARLSLWLVARAAAEPFTFLDHALRCGDSLVGLTNREIAGFRVDPRDEPERPAAGGDDAARGDAVVAALFTGGPKDRDREARRARLHAVAERARAGDERAADELRATSLQLRAGERPIAPLHWQLEFPDVFARDEPGFDCFVGNPPFCGGKRISSNFGPAYKRWLVGAFAGTSGNADLAAFFFRRAFALLRAGGTIGFIATNTIAQGDTQTSGLAAICGRGGTIYAATRRASWPGVAAVKISVVHVRRGAHPGPVILDGRRVDRISAFLRHAGGDRFPAALGDNLGRCFSGCDLKGAGFTFADDTAGASPLATMEKLCARDPRNSERIRPYIGGEEINTDPRQRHRRFVIDFEAMTLAQARAWPELLAIVEAKVAPRRRRAAPELAQWPWWQFWRVRARMRQAIGGLPRVLVGCQVSPHVAFSFQPPGRVFAHTVNVFALASFAAFAVLQSRVHEAWARLFGSSMRDDLRYTPSDCFENFPFPARADDPELEQAGARYHQLRGESMIDREEGLTRIYNRFHDPDELAPDIARLRELHAALDRAVLVAYGWGDLAERATCEFRLDHDEDDDSPRPRPRRRPWRYRWPPELHDEVLARLLALHGRRADLAGGP